MCPIKSAHFGARLRQQTVVFGRSRWQKSILHEKLRRYSTWYTFLKSVGCLPRSRWTPKRCQAAGFSRMLQMAPRRRRIGDMGSLFRLLGCRKIMKNIFFKFWAVFTTVWTAPRISVFFMIFFKTSALNPSHNAFWIVWSAVCQRGHAISNAPPSTKKHYAPICAHHCTDFSEKCKSDK